MVPGQITTPGATKTLTYDNLQRPTSIEVKNTPVSGTAQVLMSRLYQYDQAGNITQIKSDLGTTDYGYDRLSRLTQATPDQNLQTLGLPHEQYSYDAVHNRTSSGHQPGAWSYNQDNQLTHYPRTIPFNQAPPVDTSVTYTPQGHTQKETSSQWTKDYGYNAAERLTKYQSTNQGQSSPALEANYRYDPFGRRIAKSVKEASTATTYFVYGEQGLMGETDEQGKLTKGYGFNPIAAQQGLWSTDPIWQANASNGILTAQDTSFHYLHTDHLGTPQLATTKDGQASWKAQSEAFGAAGILQNQSSIEMSLRFPGQYFDTETSTHYNFHRDYKPNQGRYVQSDPMGLSGGINVNIYANQNAIRFFDPDAHAAIPAVCVANPAACGTVILVGLKIAYDGCKIIVNTVAESIASVVNEWWDDKAHPKYIEWTALHKICDGRGNPHKPQTCDWARWRFNKAKACFDARKAWMDKWNENNPKHAAQLEQVANQVKGASEEVNRYCCKDCEK